MLSYKTLIKIVSLVKMIVLHIIGNKCLNGSVPGYKWLFSIMEKLFALVL